MNQALAGALHSRLFSINNNTLKGRNLDRGFCLVFSAARPITRPHFTAAQCDDSRADLRRTRMRVRVHAFSRIYILLRIEVGGGGGGGEAFTWLTRCASCVQRTQIQDADAARLQGRQIAASVCRRQSRASGGTA